MPARPLPASTSGPSAVIQRRSLRYIRTAACSTRIRRGRSCAAAASDCAVSAAKSGCRLQNRDSRRLPVPHKLVARGVAFLRRSTWPRFAALAEAGERRIMQTTRKPLRALTDLVGQHNITIPQEMSLRAAELPAESLRERVVAAIKRHWQAPRLPESAPPVPAEQISDPSTSANPPEPEAVRNGGNVAELVSTGPSQ